MMRGCQAKSIEDNEIFYDSRNIWQDSADVGSGSWVLIIRTPPVSAYLSPKVYGIYWAVPLTEFIKPGCDLYGRQAVKVHTSEDVTIFADEYSVLSEERLEEYKREGWNLVELNTGIEVPLNMEIIQRGRTLVEEEREIIWALMLDGLTEQQSCEEYFLTKHVEANNSNICYLPRVEIREQLENIFGKR